MSLLDGRVVLVNGATQGLGAGIARAAAREGARVAITGRRRPLGESLAASLGGLFVPADLADIAAVRAAVDAVVDASTSSHRRSTVGSRISRRTSPPRRA